MADTTPTVGTPNAEHEAARPALELVRTVWGGTDAMRAAGERMLPRFEHESEEKWRWRAATAVLKNEFRKAVIGLAGKPFRRAIKLADSAPAQLADFRTDVDRNGTNLDVFAQEAFTLAMRDGCPWILVDHPPRREGLTAADVTRERVRPYLVLVDAADIIDAVRRLDAGMEVYTHLRRRELSRERSVANPYEEALVERIRQYDLLEDGGEARVQVSVFKRTDNGAWAPDGDPFLLEGVSRIPAVPIPVGREGVNRSVPPLLDLAHLNVLHYQVSSDYMDVAHRTMVPLLGLFGWSSKDEVVVSAEMALRNQSSDARAEYVEVSGQASEVGKRVLDGLEEAMRSMALEMQMAKGQVTATERVLDQDAADSALSAAALVLQQSLTQALDLVVTWARWGDSSGGCSVWRDFTLPQQDPQRAKVLLEARQAREISRLTYLGELKRLGFLSDTVVVEDEAAAVQEEAAEDAALAAALRASADDGQDDGDPAQAAA